MVSDKPVFNTAQKKAEVQKKFMEMSTRKQPIVPWMRRNSPEMRSSGVTAAIANQVKEEFTKRTSPNKIGLFREDSDVKGSILADTEYV